MNAVTPKIRKVPVPDDAVAVLSSSRVEGNLLYLPLDLERKLYERTNRAIEALGGKWNRRAKAHIFEACADSDAVAALIQSAVTTGAAEGLVDRKKTLEFYRTPSDVAERMAKWAVLEHASVLEPSAGDGALVGAALVRGASSVHCIDIDEQNCGELRKTYALENLQHYDAYVGVACRDFLTWEPRRGQRYGAVMMNPPFSRNQDIAHVRHAAGFLDPGGYLAAVTSPHWTFAEDKPSQAFRAWLDRQHVHKLDDLPTGTFSAEGTEVNAKLLFMQVA